MSHPAEPTPPGHDQLSPDAPPGRDQPPQPDPQRQPEQPPTTAALVEAAYTLPGAAARLRSGGTRMAQQVYDTLQRAPNRQEWVELGLLILWFALLVVSDLLAVQANEATLQWTGGGIWTGTAQTIGAGEQMLHWNAWLLQGLARAGFFATFAYSLWMAWRDGFGVLIARILQLKLIHTVLVVVAGLLIGGALENWTHGWDPYSYYTGLPGFLDARVLCIGLLVLAAGLSLSQLPRIWALGLALMAVFLYSGGPIQSQRYRVEQTFVNAERFAVLNDGRMIPDSWDPPFELGHEFKDGSEVVEFRKRTPESLAQYASRHYTLSNIDAQQNLIYHDTEVSGDIPLHVSSRPENWAEDSLRYPATGQPDPRGRLVPMGHPRLQGPVVAPGAGLGWLAAPIPLLGLIGLLAMVLVMGRRSVIDFVLYLALAAGALICTITPFMVGQPANDMFDFNARGLVHTPFPGFEALMIIPLDELLSSTLAATLILGLILSAGVPWLLTGLFLRPDRLPKPAAAPERAPAGAD